jgi:hypothetical protein
VNTSYLTKKEKIEIGLTEMRLSWILAVKHRALLNEALSLLGPPAEHYQLLKGFQFIRLRVAVPHTHTVPSALMS